MKKGAVVAVMMGLAMVMFMVKPGEGLSCMQIESMLAPCMPYLLNDGTPSESCCSGVRSLQSSMPTTTDRRAACECVKQAASQYQGIKPDAANQLPKKCGIEFSMPISKDIDCSKIS
ncbi:hypothetical protein HS088_TW08G00649 [Tripterygium wilfordii]|uniref:Non-specific lipid-transfer protein n=1 Tax=Tripterygium wilfordii TaxID=458696 RepID=A0A7J7DCI8_TRIWF|nr:non-specific lipid-transfer protein 1-like [Tripterygium wilfordii]KAF5744057.1 hypothetical protein HS088_TW08G00649 [Tripterygium wilfordii]